MDHQTGDLLTQSRGLCLRYSAWQVVQVYRIDDRLKTEVRQNMLCLCRYNQFIKAQNYRIIARWDQAGHLKIHSPPLVQSKTQFDIKFIYIYNVLFKR